jgi:Flp pilus assembly protein TadG
MKAPEHRTHADEHGAVLVEFAMVIGLFFLLVFGMVDYGLGVNTLTQLNNAGREAARLGTVNPNETEMRNKVLDSLASLDPAELTVTIKCEEPGGVDCTNATVGAPPGDVANAETGDSVIVTLDYKYNMITPLPRFLNDDGKFDLQSVTEMRKE